MMQRELVAPVVGFRAWRLHNERLWPIRASARRPVPFGDVRARCEASWLPPGCPAHVAPAPWDVCRCGLYAYRDVDSLNSEADADVWGAVLAWGGLEVHSRGFRSEWQRPIAVAASPSWPLKGRTAIDRVAARCGVLVTATDGLDAVAREHGAPVPMACVPLIPLELLTGPVAWDGAHPADPRALVARMAGGNMNAAHALCGFGVDIAVDATLEGAGELAMEQLEVALIGLVLAARRWVPASDCPSVAEAERDFRSSAAWWIERALQTVEAETEPGTPRAFTFEEIDDLIGKRERPPGVRPAAPPRRVPPLSADQTRDLIAALSPRGRVAWPVVDGLWDRVDNGGDDERVVTAFAYRLYRNGCRASDVVHRVIESPWQELERRETAHALARDRAVAPHFNARALSRLADCGSLAAVREYIAHPLAEPWIASGLIKDRLLPRRALGKLLLPTRSLTDAQLQVCIDTGGSRAAGLAIERLGRPIDDPHLWRACVEMLPPVQRNALISQRLDDERAGCTIEAWTVVSLLRPDERCRVVDGLLEHIAAVRDPDVRAEMLYMAWSAIDHELVPSVGEPACVLDAMAATESLMMAAELVRAAAIGDPEIPKDPVTWRYALWDLTDPPPLG